MKERIVVEADKEVYVVSSKGITIRPTDFEHTKEQVPETFEELKELCKDITLDLKICKDGTIYCYEYLLAKNRTPQQMWQIIKNLIGEE